MLEGLKPISEKHSIKNAEAQIFVPQSFVSIEQDFKTFQEAEFLNEFHRKSIIKPTQISIDKKGFGVDHLDSSGYVFESFEKDGSLKDVFSLRNLDGNRSLISLSTKKYVRWNNFKTNQLSLLYNTLKILKPYINAVGFSYLDEFDWIGEGEIPVKNIFDKNSELLNKKFLDSTNGKLVLISQGLTNENLLTEEKVELGFNNDLGKVQFLNQFLIKFKNPSRITEEDETNKLERFFDIAHKEHKSFIKNLLTKECKDLIGFKD